MAKQLFGKTEAKRLLKLATHLESGKLGHKKFDFSTYNNVYEGDIKYDKNGCGTSGCAIGECPIVFPKEWKFKPYQHIFSPSLSNSRRTPGETGNGLSRRSGIKFFGLTADEYSLLFVPVYGHAEPQIVNGVKIKYLPENSTAKKVAKNIRKFVKAKGF